jgi:hypothetical protein
MLLFFGTVVLTLVYQFVQMLTLPLTFDWLTALLLVSTIIVFIIILAGMWLLDFQAQMLLNRQGIYIEPAIFKAFTIPWDDIAELTIQDRQGLRLIEYKLKPDSPTYQARYAQLSRWRLRRFKQRSDGYDGWLPVQSYKMDVKALFEQNDVRVNRLFPLLRRYWLNPPARNELPET